MKYVAQIALATIGLFALIIGIGFSIAYLSFLGAMGLIAMAFVAVVCFAILFLEFLEGILDKVKK